MKRITNWIKENIAVSISVFIILIGIIVSNIPTVEAYDTCISGSWHDPTVETEGADISVINGGIIAKMYTYSESTSHQRWYTMVFDSDSNGIATIYTTKDKLNRFASDVGNASIDILSDDEILLILNLGLDLDSDLASPWCIGCVKVFEYTPLTRLFPCE